MRLWEPIQSGQVVKVTRERIRQEQAEAQELGLWVNEKLIVRKLEQQYGRRVELVDAIPDSPEVVVVGDLEPDPVLHADRCSRCRQRIFLRAGVPPKALRSCPACAGLPDSSP